MTSPKPKPRRRRKSSYSISIAPDVDEITYDPPSMRSMSRRRSSYVTSLALDDDDDFSNDEDLLTQGGSRLRPWERSEKRLRESIKSMSSRSPVSHHECNLNLLLALLLLILRFSLFLKFSMYNESYSMLL